MRSYVGSRLLHCAQSQNGRSHLMEVLAITIFLSLLLSIFFVVLFLGQRRKRGGIEHESLLPLDDGPSPTTTPISVTVD